LLAETYRGAYARFSPLSPVQKADLERVLRVEPGCLTGRWAGAKRKIQGKPLTASTIIAGGIFSQ